MIGLRIHDKIHVKPLNSALVIFMGNSFKTGFSVMGGGPADVTFTLATNPTLLT